MIVYGKSTVYDVIVALEQFDRPCYKVLSRFYRTRSPNGLILARTYIIRSEKDLLSWPEFGPAIINYMKKDEILSSSLQNAINH